MKPIASLLASVVISAVIFLSIPVTNFMKLEWISAPEEKTYELAKAAQKMPPKKLKTPPKQQKPPPKSQPKQAPKSMSRNHLVMDLGPGGGSGGAVVGGQGAMDQLAYEEGETDVAPVALRNSPPSYPEKALKMGVGGVVKFRALITTEGAVDIGSVEFIETPGDYGFEEEILKVLPNWKFKPATLDGIPVAVKMEFPLEF